MKTRIGIVGSGNMAWHLSDQLTKLDYTLTIYARSNSLAQEIADEFSYKAVPSLELLMECDLIFTAVSDDAIENIADQLAKVKVIKWPILIHTSGSISSSILSAYPGSVGVMWPLQSLSKGHSISFIKIPIFITSENKSVGHQLEIIARRMSESVYQVTDEERSYYHLAAVISNNFINHLLAQSESFLKANDLNYQVLEPIVKETVSKAFSTSPSNVQTGPARRQDSVTIKRHRRQLKEYPSLRRIYRTLTKSIIRKYEDR